MPIEIPTEVLYTLIFFLIIVAVILFFIFSTLAPGSIQNFWGNITNFFKSFSQKFLGVSK
ncbi:MAG: hypothetical protein QW197_01960 [Candidatus Aenigmatarchaeota archaeon]